MSDVFGKPVWFEIVTADPEASKRFYGEVIGWKTSEMPMGDESYTMFQAGSHQPQCGIAGWKPEGHGYWAGYLEAGDIDAAIGRVKANGGTVLGDVITAPGVGKMAPVKDPQGAAFFLFEGERSDTSGYDSKPGKFHWFELMVPDIDAVLPFYKAVFGYEVQSMDMGNGIYHVFNSGGESRGGGMSMPKGDHNIPPHWLPYVHVDDIDAAYGRAQKLGAQTYMAPFDVPDIGRMAIVGDPQGATIGIITPPKG